MISTKNIDETRNYLIEEINQNELMSKKHKKLLTFKKATKLLPILIFTVTRWVSISTFASLVGILLDITSSAKGLKIFVIIAGIKKYKFIIKKKKKT